MDGWVPVRTCVEGTTCNCCLHLATILFHRGFPALTTFTFPELDSFQLGHRLYLPADQVEIAWNSLPEAIQQLYPFRDWLPKPDEAN